jgi:biopolymer transport protein ExbD
VADAAHIVQALAQLRRGEGPVGESMELVLDRRLEESRAKRRARGRQQPNLMPMIDVTFLLLVFFVCTTKVLDKERLLRADLSERGGAVVGDALSLEEPPLRIEVRMQDGHSALRVMAPLPQPADAEQLASLLASKLYGPANPGGLFAADQPIELAPSKDAPWEDAVAAFNAITRAGYTRVSFARPQ